jgi:hypothetical protein
MQGEEMRRTIAIAIVAAGLLAARSQAWEYFIVSGGKTYGGLRSTGSNAEAAMLGWAPSITAPAPTSGTLINTADPANSWVEFGFNVITTASTDTRDLIVFRDPLNAQVAPQLSAFQAQLNAGKKLVLIRNPSRSAYVISNNWEGFSTQTSYEILPGDQVTFYFK